MPRPPSTTRPSTPPPWADCVVIATRRGHIWRALPDGRWVGGPIIRTAEELEWMFGPCTPIVGPGGIPVVRASVLAAILSDAFASTATEHDNWNTFLYLETAIRRHVYILEDLPTEDGPQS